MGGKTPTRIKQRVIKLWLSGLPRDEIAKKVGTSEGNINNIVTEVKKDIPDIDLLRELAVQIRKKGWDQDRFSSAIRHRNILYKKKLTDDQIDDLIESIDEHCFKKNIRFNNFAHVVQTVSLISEKYNCSIEGLDELKAENENEVERLKTEVESLRSEIDALKSTRLDVLLRHKLTETEIVQYNHDKPLVDTIKTLRQEIEDAKISAIFERAEAATRESLYYEMWNIPYLPENMTVEDVGKAAKLLARNALLFEKQIKYILKMESSLPYGLQGTNPNFKGKLD
jgi:hypothetical protein